MGCYIVYRHLPGITPEALKGAGLRALSCAAEMSEEGTPIRWLRSYFIPETEQTHCFFDAPSFDAVKEVNERANIPFSKIHMVHELTPEDV